MKLYTVKMNGAETLLVSLDGGKTAYALRDLGYYFRSMNQLIQDITPEQVAALNALKDGPISAPVVEWDSVKLCAPIPSPRQDVICLGINYDEHAKEAGGFSEEAFGGERPYTSTSPSGSTWLPAAATASPPMRVWWTALTTRPSWASS